LGRAGLVFPSPLPLRGVVVFGLVSAAGDFTFPAGSAKDTFFFTLDELDESDIPLATKLLLPLSPPLPSLLLLLLLLPLLPSPPPPLLLPFRSSALEVWRPSLSDSLSLLFLVEAFGAEGAFGTLVTSTFFTGAVFLSSGPKHFFDDSGGCCRLLAVDGVRCCWTGMTSCGVVGIADAGVMAGAGVGVNFDASARAGVNADVVAFASVGIGVGTC